VQCPACEDGLAPSDYNGLTVNRCPSCSGSWLAGPAFGSLLQMDGSGFSPRDVAKLKVLLEYRVAKSLQPTEHPCPRCRKKLKARNYASIAGFFVEQCPGGCGVWIREGDMDRIRILRSLGVVEEVKSRAKAKPAAGPTEAAKPVPEVPGPALAAVPPTGPPAAASPAVEPGPPAEPAKPPAKTTPPTRREPRVREPSPETPSPAPEREGAGEEGAPPAAEGAKPGFFARLFGRLFGRR
jgi:Zn-finger nucleic acid-binding protein